MIESQILSAIISSLSVQKQKTEMEQIARIKDFVEKFEQVKSMKASDTHAFIDEVVFSYQLLTEKIKKKNKTHSVLFNPLTFFSIGETMHSFLIANLIDPEGKHGQGNIFLKSFLKLLDIEVFDNDNWIVTAEKGRIDVLIRRLHPHTVIVIENKSNFADDKENQLYRYWFQEIYLPNYKKYGDKTIEQTSNNTNYQLIYLSPADWKLPNDNSMVKPNGYDDALPDRIPIEPKIWLFNKHIVKWLNDATQELHEDNHRLREYIKQYIELWTE